MVVLLSILAGPRIKQRLDGQHSELLLHPLWPCLNVADHSLYQLAVADVPRDI
jgi:hypothetical protein